MMMGKDHPEEITRITLLKITQDHKTQVCQKAGDQDLKCGKATVVRTCLSTFTGRTLPLSHKSNTKPRTYFLTLTQNESHISCVI